MRLLFITRKYPPMVGGMEKVSHGLIQELSKKIKLYSLTWGHSQKYLPLVLPYFLFKSITIIPRNGITHVHLGDALLSHLGLFLKLLFGIKCSVTVHGLDVTFKFPPYQWIVIFCLKKLDKIICVSNATLEECVKRGVPRNKCVFIPNGVYPQDFQIKATKKDLEKVIGTKINSQKVLITVGRMVERKGVYWFIKNVFPAIKDKYIYLVVGDGPERQRIRSLIEEKKLKEKVFLMGRISDRNLKILYNTADYMVLPNIQVPGDMEGFGIVAIEASSTGLPVVVSNIEGLKDAVISGKNGYLVEPEPRYFTRVLKSEIELNKDKVHSYVKENYSWKTISNTYLTEFYRS